MKFYPLILLVLTSILWIDSPAYSQEVRIDFATVFNVVSNIFNPPHRAAQEKADAEVAKERARRAAEIEKLKVELEASKNVDRAAPVVTKWGVERISCAPGAVFINGIISDTVCIKPNDRISAGYYTYDSTRQQLVRNSNTNAAQPNRSPSKNGVTDPQVNRDRGF